MVVRSLDAADVGMRADEFRQSGGSASAEGAENAVRLGSNPAPLIRSRKNAHGGFLAARAMADDAEGRGCVQEPIKSALSDMQETPDAQSERCDKKRERPACDCRSHPGKVQYDQCKDPQHRIVPPHLAAGARGNVVREGTTTRTLSPASAKRLYDLLERGQHVGHIVQQELNRVLRQRHKQTGRKHRSLPLEDSGAAEADATATFDGVVSCSKNPCAGAEFLADSSQWSTALLPPDDVRCMFPLFSPDEAMEYWQFHRALDAERQKRAVAAKQDTFSPDSESVTTLQGAVDLVSDAEVSRRQAQVVLTSLEGRAEVIRSNRERIQRIALEKIHLLLGRQYNLAVDISQLKEDEMDVEEILDKEAERERRSRIRGSISPADGPLHCNEEATAVSGGDLMSAIELEDDGSASENSPHVTAETESVAPSCEERCQKGKSQSKRRLISHTPHQARDFSLEGIKSVVERLERIKEREIARGGDGGDGYSPHSSGRQNRFLRLTNNNGGGGGGSVDVPDSDDCARAAGAKRVSRLCIRPSQNGIGTFRPAVQAGGGDLKLLFSVLGAGNEAGESIQSVPQSHQEANHERYTRLLTERESGVGFVSHYDAILLLLREAQDIIVSTYDLCGGGELRRHRSMRRGSFGGGERGGGRYVAAAGESAFARICAVSFALRKMRKEEEEEEGDLEGMSPNRSPGRELIGEEEGDRGVFRMRDGEEIQLLPFAPVAIPFSHLDTAERGEQVERKKRRQNRASSIRALEAVSTIIADTDDYVQDDDLSVASNIGIDGVEYVKLLQFMWDAVKKSNWTLRKSLRTAKCPLPRYQPLETCSKFGTSLKCGGDTRLENYEEGTPSEIAATPSIAGAGSRNTSWGGNSVPDQRKREETRAAYSHTASNEDAGDGGDFFRYAGTPSALGQWGSCSTTPDRTTGMDTREHGSEKSGTESEGSDSGRGRGAASGEKLSFGGYSDWSEADEFLLGLRELYGLFSYRALLEAQRRRGGGGKTEEEYALEIENKLMAVRRRRKQAETLDPSILDEVENVSMEPENATGTHARGSSAQSRGPTPLLSSAMPLANAGIGVRFAGSDGNSYPPAFSHVPPSGQPGAAAYEAMLTGVASGLPGEVTLSLMSGWCTNGGAFRNSAATDTSLSLEDRSTSYGSRERAESAKTRATSTREELTPHTHLNGESSLSLDSPKLASRQSSRLAAMGVTAAEKRRVASGQRSHRRGRAGRDASGVQPPGVELSTCTLSNSAVCTVYGVSLSQRGKEMPTYSAYDFLSVWISSDGDGTKESTSGQNAEDKNGDGGNENGAIVLRINSEKTKNLTVVPTAAVAPHRGSVSHSECYRVRVPSTSHVHALTLKVIAKEREVQLECACSVGDGTPVSLSLRQSAPPDSNRSAHKHLPPKRERSQKGRHGGDAAEAEIESTDELSGAYLTGESDGEGEERDERWPGERASPQGDGGSDSFPNERGGLATAAVTQDTLTSFTIASGEDEQSISGSVPFGRHGMSTSTDQRERDDKMSVECGQAVRKRRSSARRGKKAGKGVAAGTRKRKSDQEAHTRPESDDMAHELSHPSAVSQADGTRILTGKEGEEVDEGMALCPRDVVVSALRIGAGQLQRSETLVSPTSEDRSGVHGSGDGPGKEAEGRGTLSGLDDVVENLLTDSATDVWNNESPRLPHVRTSGHLGSGSRVSLDDRPFVSGSDCVARSQTSSDADLVSRKSQLTPPDAKRTSTSAAEAAVVELTRRLARSHRRSSAELIVRSALRRIAEEERLIDASLAQRAANILVEARRSVSNADVSSYLLRRRSTGVDALLQASVSASSGASGRFSFLHSGEHGVPQARRISRAGALQTNTVETKTGSGLRKHGRVSTDGNGERKSGSDRRGSAAGDHNRQSRASRQRHLKNQSVNPTSDAETDMEKRLLTKGRKKAGGSSSPRSPVLKDVPEFPEMENGLQCCTTASMLRQQRGNGSLMLVPGDWSAHHGGIGGRYGSDEGGQGNVSASGAWGSGSPLALPLPTGSLGERRSTKAVSGRLSLGAQSASPRVSGEWVGDSPAPIRVLPLEASSRRVYAPTVNVPHSDLAEFMDRTDSTSGAAIPESGSQRQEPHAPFHSHMSPDISMTSTTGITSPTRPNGVWNRFSTTSFSLSASERNNSGHSQGHDVESGVLANVAGAVSTAKRKHSEGDDDDDDEEAVEEKLATSRRASKRLSKLVSAINHMRGTTPKPFSPVMLSHEEGEMVRESPFGPGQEVLEQLESEARRLFRKDPRMYDSIIDDLVQRVSERFAVHGFTNDAEKSEVDDDATNSGTAVSEGGDESSEENGGSGRGINIHTEQSELEARRGTVGVNSPLLSRHSSRFLKRSTGRAEYTTTLYKTELAALTDKKERHQRLLRAVEREKQEVHRLFRRQQLAKEMMLAVVDEMRDIWHSHQERVNRVVLERELLLEYMAQKKGLKSLHTAALELSWAFERRRLLDVNKLVAILDRKLRRRLPATKILSGTLHSITDHAWLPVDDADIYTPAVDFLPQNTELLNRLLPEKNIPLHENTASTAMLQERPRPILYYAKLKLKKVKQKTQQLGHPDFDVVYDEWVKEKEAKKRTGCKNSATNDTCITTNNTEIVNAGGSGTGDGGNAGGELMQIEAACRLTCFPTASAPSGSATVGKRRLNPSMTRRPLTGQSRQLLQPLHPIGGRGKDTEVEALTTNVEEYLQSVALHATAEATERPLPFAVVSGPLLCARSPQLTILPQTFQGCGEPVSQPTYSIKPVLIHTQPLPNYNTGVRSTDMSLSSFPASAKARREQLNRWARHAKKGSPAM